MLFLFQISIAKWTIRQEEGKIPKQFYAMHWYTALFWHQDIS